MKLTNAEFIHTVKSLSFKILETNINAIKCDKKLKFPTWEQIIYICLKMHIIAFQISRYSQRVWIIRRSSARDPLKSTHLYNMDHNHMWTDWPRYYSCRGYRGQTDTHLCPPHSGRHANRPGRRTRRHGDSWRSNRGYRGRSHKGWGLAHRGSLKWGWWTM